MEALTWLTSFGAARATNLLVLAWAPFNSIKACRSPDSQNDAKKWLIFWVIYFFSQVFEDSFENLLEMVPFFYEIKLAFTVFLLFFGGSELIYKVAITPFMDKYGKVIDDKISAIADTDVKELLKDPNALKKLLQDEAAMIAKYGKKSYDEMVGLATEKNNATKKE